VKRTTPPPTSAPAAAGATQSASPPATTPPAPAAEAKPTTPARALQNPAVSTAPLAPSGVSNSAEAQTQPVETFDDVVTKAPRSYGVSTRDNRVVLRATDPVFVRVETQGPRKQVLFEGMLGQNELYYVPAMPDVVLVTRNGGALDVFVDGEDTGHAGPAGIALKGVPLDPEALKAPH
jgi:hypothetical protein